MKTLLVACAVLLSALPVSAQPLLVMNKEGSLAFVDPNTEKVLGLVRTGDNPHEVAWRG